MNALPSNQKEKECGERAEPVGEVNIGTASENMRIMA